MFLVVGKRLSLRGFIVGDHADLRPQFTEAVTGWLRRRVSPRSTTRRGPLLDPGVDRAV